MAQSRGRKVEPAKQGSQMRIFYIVIAIVAIGGVALLVTVLTGQNQQTPANNFDPASGEVMTTDYPTGRTAEGFHYKGNADAPVTVVEYADFQCPACGAFTNSSVYERLQTEYVVPGHIRYVFHDFPLSYHDKAPIASQAAYCAGDQGAFWQMHDLIFRNQSSWAAMPATQFGGYLDGLAQQIGLDVQGFQSCVNNGTYAAHVQGTYQAAVNAGIPATPTFVVNGTQVSSTELMTAIDAALAAQSGS